MNNFISTSIDLHLFFIRIMKEHAIFLEAGFQMKDEEFIKAADIYKVQFEELLEETLEIGQNWVSAEVVESGEIVTQYTLNAERKTQNLTGISINSNITKREHQLKGMALKRNINIRQIEFRVRRLNRRVLNLLNSFISFKERILRDVQICKLFTANYPLLIEHIIREAKLYRSFLIELERRGMISQQHMKDMEEFWNQIMMEHALFIRGLLDPTEKELIITADKFARDYEKLLKEARDKNDSLIDGERVKTIETTIKYRDFKAAGTKGISECEISSIILPLLADHVIREANHYLRLLKE